jgi:hypothetical protein
MVVIFIHICNGDLTEENYGCGSEKSAKQGDWYHFQVKRMEFMQRLSFKEIRDCGG